MQFLILFVDRPGAPAPDPAGLAALEVIVRGLAREGRFLRGATLAAAEEAARIRVRDGRVERGDGPVAAGDDVCGGFWLVEAATREEAIELARRAFEAGAPQPEKREGRVEVHGTTWRRVFLPDGPAPTHLLAYRMEPGLSDPDGAKMQEMVAFSEARAREGTMVETAPLASDPPPARIQSRGGKTLVTDGPFAETKDVVGGYGLVRATSRAEAIALALQVPHARWGPIEVRALAGAGAA